MHFDIIKTIITQVKWNCSSKFANIDYYNYFLPPRPHFPWLSCRPPIKFGIPGEAVDERHKGIAYPHQAMARSLADKSERRKSSFGARAASVLMCGTRSGGLVLMGFNAWPPYEQKIAPKKGATFLFALTRRKDSGLTEKFTDKPDNISMERVRRTWSAHYSNFSLGFVVIRL